MRRSTLTAMVWVVGTAGAACTALTLAVTVTAQHAWSASVSTTALALTLPAVLLGPFWVVATDVLVLDGRVRAFAVVTVVQAFTSNLTTIVCLFAVDLGVTALFVGQLAGALVYAIGAAWALGPDLDRSPRREVIREVTRGAPLFTAGQALDAVQQIAERTLLARFSGLSSLGLYTHAQRYRALAGAGVTALARGIWPTTLTEASAGAFPRTLRAWRLVHVALGFAGIAAATVGDRFIALLTHDQFTSAQPYAAALIAVVILQNTAKPQIGAVFGLGRAGQAAGLSLVSGAVGLPALLLLVPPAGAWGAVTAVALQVAAYRIGAYAMARTLGSTPFGDAVPLASASLTVGVLVLTRATDPDLAHAVALLLAGCLAIVLVALLDRRVAERSAPIIGHVANASAGMRPADLDPLGGAMERWAQRALDEAWVDGWVEGAIFPRELVAFLAACEINDVVDIVECGRQDGYSTAFVAAYCREHGGRVTSIDLELDAPRAARCRERLAGFPNIDYRRGDAFAEFGRVAAGIPASRRTAVLMDGPKGFQAMSLLFAASIFPGVVLVAEHNLNWGSPEQACFSARSTRPTHYEELRSTALGAAWAALGEAETLHGTRVGAARRLDRSSLGILVLDSATRESCRRAGGRHFMLQQPRAIAALWRRRRFDDVARLARVSFAIERRLPGRRRRATAGDDD